ncbi:MAG: hypothetical protein ACRDSH_17840 [Pseudonocardiaceae bacterium]
MSEPSDPTFTKALVAFIAEVANSGMRECPCEPCVYIRGAYTELLAVVRTARADTARI